MTTRTETPPGPREVASTFLPSWVRAADALTLALVALAVVVLVTGGVRTEVRGVRLSVTSDTRILLWTMAVFLIRHAAYRRVTLLARLRTSPLIARLRARWPRLVSPNEPQLSANAGPRSRWRSAGEYAAVLVFLSALTAVMTYPQLWHLDRVRDLGDPLFSVWRLAWIAHQLPRDPLSLFDANIFYPARHTLALSDSILLPGLVCAPFLWLGFSAVKTYNVCLLASFALSGTTMYALARVLTGQRLPALIAAVAFAFYPFRFEHYSHFELQMSFCIPLVLLGLHRTVATGRLRDGLLTGLAFVGQMFTGMYLALFLAVYIVPVWLVIERGWRAGWRSVRPLTAGALLAGVLVAPLAAEYLAARQTFGGRNMYEVAFYSPHASRYLSPHPSSATWGSLDLQAHLPEQDLFPGLLILALAAMALRAPAPASLLAYFVALIVAFDASLGVNGHLYPALYKYVGAFRSLRVPARLSMLVGTSLAILAGYGAARLVAAWKRPAARYATCAVLLGLLCLELRPVPIALVEPYRPHKIYSWVSTHRVRAIAELPTAGGVVDALAAEVRYQFLSLTHWQRLANGNSGILPPGYVEFTATVARFPDEASVTLLRTLGVDCVIVHEEFYADRAKYREVVDAASHSDAVVEVAREMDGGTEARVYRMR